MFNVVVPVNLKPLQSQYHTTPLPSQSSPTHLQEREKEILFKQGGGIERKGPLPVPARKRMWGKRKVGMKKMKWGRKGTAPIIKQWIAKSFFPVPPCFSVSSFKSFYCSLSLCRPFCSASDDEREREKLKES
jgi:hypothetical protein